MKQRWIRFGTRWVSGGIIVAVSGCLAYFLLQKLGAIFSILQKCLKVLEPFTIGIAFAFLINLPMVFIENRLTKLNAKKKRQMSHALIRAISLILAILLFLAAVGLFLASILPQLAESISTFMGNIDSYLGEMNAFLDRVAAKFHLDPSFADDVIPNFDQFVSLAVDFVTNSISDVLSTASEVGSTLLNVVIGLILSVYFLASKEMFFGQGKKVLYALTKPEKADRFMRVTFLANRTFTGFVSGKLVDSLIIGILCFVGLAAMKMPYALLVSVIIGVTNIIPFFGPIIGAVPSTLIVLLVDPLKALLLLVFVVILQQFDGNILGPRILGDSTGLPTLWVMFAILVGSGLFGFVGMLISVPTFAVVYALFREAINGRLTQKGLSTDPAPYRRPGALHREEAQSSSPPEDESTPS